MKLNYVCKHNGVLYPIGVDVPIGDFDAPIEDAKEDVVSEENKVYTRSEIQLMKSEDLKKLAESEGIENASSTSGSQLKKILISHFGL